MSLSSSSPGNGCPRLIDYILFVGRKHPTKGGVAISQPELLRLYPPVHHHDYALPEDIVFFCQPEGCYNTTSKSILSDRAHAKERHHENIKTEFFSFALTDKDSNSTRYGVCLNFLRPIGRRKTSYTAEVSRRRISSFKSAIYRDTEASKTNDSFGYLSDSSSSTNSSNFRGGDNFDRPERPFTHTLTSICLVSQYQFCKKFEKCLQFLYTLVQKLHEGCKPRYSGRQTVWSALTGMILSPELPSVRKSIEEIDTWILRLLSIPAPVSGKTAVRVFLQPADLHNPIVFALPDVDRFPLVDYSLHMPIQLLGVDKFLKVFFSLLLEEKVVLESSHHDRLTTCVLAFTALTYPLQYLFTVIPLLPSSFRGAEEILHAPSPYIIGLPRSFRDSRPSFHLPKEVLLVDLDTQELELVTFSVELERYLYNIPKHLKDNIHELYGQTAHDPVPKLPPIEEKQLHSQLTEGLGRLGGRKGIQIHNGRSKGSTTSSPSSTAGFPTVEMDEDSINVALRIAMVRFFKSPNILGGFSEHTRTVRIYPRPIVAFQYEKFMKSRPDPSPFTIVLAKTQSVEYLAEWFLLPTNVAYLRIGNTDPNPRDIGDKDHWFSDNLTTIPFQLWTERFEKGLLRAVVDQMATATPRNGRSFSSSRNILLSVLNSPDATTFSSTSGIPEIDGLSDSETATDVSPSYGDSQSNLDTATPSDANSWKPHRVSIADIFAYLFEGEELLGYLGNTVANPKASLSPQDWQSPQASLSAPAEGVDSMITGKPLPSHLRAYYSPPMSLVIPDSAGPPSRTTAPTSSLFASDSSSAGRLLSELSQRLQNNVSDRTLSTASAILYGSKQLPSMQRFSLAAAASPPLDSISLSPAGSSASGSPVNRLPPPKTSTLGSIVNSWFVDSPKPPDSTSDTTSHKQRADAEISENQRFVMECVSAIRKGNFPGVFSRRRFQKLMEEEIYRNFALALANENVGHRIPLGQNHIPDVSLESWDHYKAYVWLFTQIGFGVRQSIRPMVTTTFMDARGDIISPSGLANTLRDLFTSQAEKERVSRGGVCSAFRLLEMAHTHLYVLPNKRIQPPAKKTSQAASLPSTPKVERRSTRGGSSVNRNDVSELGIQIPTTHQIAHHDQIITFQDSKSDGLGQLSPLRFHPRDLPDLVELSQKLQARLTEAFKNSPIMSPRRNPDHQQTNHLPKAYLSRDAALRLSERICSTQSALLQPSTKSRTRRRCFQMQASHTIDYDNEMPSAHDDWRPGGTVRLSDNRECLRSNCRSVSSTRSGVSARSRSSLRQNRLLRDSGTTFNVINPQNTDPLTMFSGSAPGNSGTPNNSTLRGHVGNDETNSSSDAMSMELVEDVVLLAPFKSVESLGFRYRHGRLFQTASTVSGPQPPSISVPALRCNISDQKAQSSSGGDGGVPQKTASDILAPAPDAKSTNTRSAVHHNYLFEEALVTATESKLWTNMQFWEDLFLDTIAQERATLGMDFDPHGLVQHYIEVGALDKRSLELSEDALLSGVMHNLVAFMVMAKVPADQIRLKVRRLLAKSHTGLHYTQKVTKLLDCLDWLRGNDIDLLPFAIQHRLAEPFPVFLIWGEGDLEMFTMEIFEECFILRRMTGRIQIRWWFDNIVNITHSPQTNIICVQTLIAKRRDRYMFTGNSTQQMFSSIALAISRARSKRHQVQIFEKLGGCVDVTDVKSSEQGTLEISPDGFNLIFGSESKMIHFEQIKSCLVSGEGTFSFVVAGLNNDDITWNFKTDMASVLLNQWERLIGVALIKNPMHILSGAATPLTSRSRASSLSNFETVFDSSGNGDPNSSVPPSAF